VLALALALVTIVVIVMGIVGVRVRVAEAESSTGAGEEVLGIIVGEIRVLALVVVSGVIRHRGPASADLRYCQRKLAPGAGRVVAKGEQFGMADYGCGCGCG